MLPTVVSELPDGLARLENMEETEVEEAIGVSRPRDRWDGVLGRVASGDTGRGVEGVDRLCSVRERKRISINRMQRNRSEVGTDSYEL